MCLNGTIAPSIFARRLICACHLSAIAPGFGRFLLGQDPSTAWKACVLRQAQGQEWQIWCQALCRLRHVPRKQYFIYFVTFVTKKERTKKKVGVKLSLFSKFCLLMSLEYLDDTVLHLIQFLYLRMAVWVRQFFRFVCRWRCSWTRTVTPCVLTSLSSCIRAACQ